MLERARSEVAATRALANAARMVADNSVVRVVSVGLAQVWKLHVVVGRARQRRRAGVAAVLCGAENAWVAAGVSGRVLLARVVDHLSAAGLNDLSLRSLAAGVGTSHRMLIYHFGSYDGLVGAVVAEVEQRQRRLLQQSADLDGLSLVGLALQLWERVSAEELWPLERLFFGLYARLLQSGQPELAAGLVRGWLEPVELLLISRGVPPAEAARSARLGLAVTRGLLLDLLATGDREAVDSAMHRYVDVVYGSG